MSHTEKTQPGANWGLWVCCFAVVAIGGVALAVAGLDPKLWRDAQTVLPWLAGGLLLGGFVALLVKYPRLANALQTVLLVFIALVTLIDLLTPPRDR